MARALKGPSARRAAVSLRDPMAPRLFRVRRLRWETADVATFDLEPSGRPHPCGFAPGQFNMLYVFGVGEVPISISGDPGAPMQFVHTVHQVSVVTSALCRLSRGTTLGVRGPFGVGWPMAEAQGQDLVLVAGGIGLAPLRSVLCELVRHRERYGRIALLYGTRSPEDLLYRQELERWRGRVDLEVHVTVDRAAPEWRGHVGVVTTLVRRVAMDPAKTLAMVCGPEVMMRFALQELQKHGLPPGRIFLSMERNMHCGIGLCGHCQYGPIFVCRDGPVVRADRLAAWFGKREV
ncbi:MAG: Ni/Fe hydrogenase subunit gamma [Omnitrophica WOR_2 bacterium RIFCSPHIGHO2_02_FULL_68_15]|nr:MAG: Ni/Fe hydrogenase subunit gamma [Omnitrophica WOR_2 bacterium RIFCSPHIGHO2_02_FULL_68_15]